MAWALGTHLSVQPTTLLLLLLCQSCAVAHSQLCPRMPDRRVLARVSSREIQRREWSFRARGVEHGGGSDLCVWAIYCRARVATTRQSSICILAPEAMLLVQDRAHDKWDASHWTLTLPRGEDPSGLTWLQSLSAASGKRSARRKIELSSRFQAPAACHLLLGSAAAGCCCSLATSTCKAALLSSRCRSVAQQPRAPDHSQTACGRRFQDPSREEGSFEATTPWSALHALFWLCHALFQQACQPAETAQQASERASK